MHVVLRCDASAGSGVGHLVRALALAEAAGARGWPTTLAGTVQAPLGCRLVAAAGVPVVAAEPAAGLAAQAADLGAGVLHLDHYDLTGDWRGAVPGAVVSSMEDGAFGRRAADVVVDSTLGAERGDRPADGSGLLLRGIGYAPLRGSVLAARRRAATDGDGHGVLVVMGGTDAFGASAAAARLAQAAGGGPVRVVAPSDVADQVRAAAPGAELLGPQDDLPAVAAEAGLVFSAAGTSVWELACVGVPMALVAVTENQTAGLQQAVDAGIAVQVGTLDEVRSADRAAVGRLRGLLADPDRRAMLRAAGRRLVDGHGAERVLDGWWAATGHPVVRARPATPADGDLLLGWRNDPATRSASRSQDPVDRDEHLAWLDRVLADPARDLMVVERTGVPAGTVRVDRETERLWEISITLAPWARGRDAAGEVLAAAERSWRDRVGPVPDLLACVRPENAASARLFLDAGYLPDRPRPDRLDAYVKPGG